MSDETPISEDAEVKVTSDAVAQTITMEIASEEDGAIAMRMTRERAIALLAELAGEVHWLGPA